MAYLTVEQYQRFIGCAARQDLLAREGRLRSDLQLEPDRDRQFVLAKNVDEAQKMRFRHEERLCPICLQIQIEMEEEGAGLN